MKSVEEILRGLALRLEEVRETMLQPDPEEDPFRGLDPVPKQHYLLAANLLEQAIRHLNLARLQNGQE